MWSMNWLNDCLLANTLVGKHTLNSLDEQIVDVYICVYQTGVYTCILHCISAIQTRADLRGITEVKPMLAATQAKYF